MRNLVWLFAFVLVVSANAEQTPRTHGSSSKARPRASGYTQRAKPMPSDPVYPKVPIPPGLSEIINSGMPERDRQLAEVEAYVNHPPYRQFMDKMVKKALARSSREVQERYKGLKFMAFWEKWKASHPKATPTQLALSLAVLETGAASVLGEMDAELCGYTERYTQKTARIDRGGHLDMNNRPALRRGGSIDENEAVSSDSLGRSIMEHAMECVRSWNNSQGHKVKMDRYHTRFCHDMRRTNRGWYRCVAQWVDSLPRE